MSWEVWVMTSKTSLFNRGIYWSTFRRFIWGAVLYAIALFLMTALPILSTVDPINHWRIGKEPMNSLILTDVYIMFPIFLAAVIPTVAALLAFRFIHSKKHSIFIHSLPVSREANFISTIFAVFSLMAAPVIFNGIILGIMSLCGYGELFNIQGVLLWTGYNLFAIFIMLGAASFCASLTGNSFALVGLNILLHLIAIIITAILSIFAGKFLYGYPNSSELIDVAARWNYVTYIFNLGLNYDYVAMKPLPFGWVMFAVMAATAVAFYVIALILCKKRRIETAEDIAAYKVFGPIFKYMLTFFAACGVFAIYASESLKMIVPFVVTLLLVTAVVYFALEMIIRKTFKVWDSYKGFVALLLGFVIFVSFFAFSTGFGYETRIPPIENIEAVSVYNYKPYGEESEFSSSPEVIAYIENMQRELIAPEMRYILREAAPERYNSIWIKYKLKNGRELARNYYVDAESYHSYMKKLFEVKGYREAFIDAFTIDESRVVDSLMDSEAVEAKELLSVIREDILNMDYEEYKFSGWSEMLTFEYLYDEVLGAGRGRAHINANYEKTIEYLCQKGVANRLFDINGDFAVISADEWRRYLDYPQTVTEDMPADARIYAAASAKESPKISDFPNARRITSPDEKAALQSFVLNYNGRYKPKQTAKYYICRIDEVGYLNQAATVFNEAEELKRFM